MKSIAKNNTSPRGYLSWTQLNLIERNPKMYYRAYIEGFRVPENKYMRFGKRFAKCLELGYDEQRDPMIESIAFFMPSYPKREFEMRAALKDIPLLGKLDGWNVRTEAIGDYKTGKNYTQSMADNSGQLTFYAFLRWLKSDKLLKKLFIHWAQTSEDKNGDIFLTGKIKTFETKRTVKDFILFSKRISVAWNDICELGRIFDVKQ